MDSVHISSSMDFVVPQSQKRAIGVCQGMRIRTCRFNYVKGYLPVYLPFLISHRGDSGQKKIPRARGTAGMKALPSCNRHAIGPVSLTAVLAYKR